MRTKGSSEKRKRPPTSKELLDMFLDDKWDEGDTPIEAMSDVEFVNHMLKIRARRTLDKHKRDAPLSPVQAEAKEASPNGISPIKTCRNCYFCMNFRVIGVDWYAACSNTGRSRKAEGSTLWIKAQHNLPCWRQKK